jgi:hypothetical protein
VAKAHLDSFSLYATVGGPPRDQVTVRTLGLQPLLHTMTSIARRSSSTSATSTKSRATLVEIDPDLAEAKESTFEATDEDLPDLPPKSNFFNHLLEMFCLKWLKLSKGKSQVFHLHSSYSLVFIIVSQTFLGFGTTSPISFMIVSVPQISSCLQLFIPAEQF